MIENWDQSEFTSNESSKLLLHFNKCRLATVFLPLSDMKTSSLHELGMLELKIFSIEVFDDVEYLSFLCRFTQD